MLLLLRDLVLSGRKLPQGKPDRCRLRPHQTSEARIKRHQSRHDGKCTTRPIHANRTHRMRRADKLRNSEEEERERERDEHGEDGDVGAQRGEDEEEREQAPGDEVNAHGDGEGTLVAAVGRFEAEGGDHEHGKGEPEGTVGAVDGATKAVAHAELEDAGDELGSAAVEDGEAEDGLVWAHWAEGISSWKTDI